MSPDLTALATAGVQQLKPYQPGKSPRELGLTDVVKLASNESPLGAGPAARQAAAAALESPERYPDGNGSALKRALSRHVDVAVERITLGNGSNDVLDLVARAFVSPDHEVIFSEHAFAVYPLVTRAVGARPVVAAAADWGHDLEAMADAVTDRTRLIFVANPNNPTGTWIRRAELRRLVRTVPDHVLVVVDEAYCDYLDDPAYPDCTRWLEDHPNLIVTRTFSKAYGLAGLRVGYGISHPQVADVLNRVRQPFNVNAVALAAAAAALGDREHLERAVEVNRTGMTRLTEGLDALGLDYIPSAGNFLSIDVGRPAAEVFDELLDRGVIVRPLGGYDMPNHVRVTVGLEEQNARLLDALAGVAEAGRAA